MIHCKRAAAAAILVIVAATPLAAQSGWSRVGHGGLAGETGRATIAVHGEPTYHQLMLCADGHPVRILSIVITYADNHTQELRDGERFAHSECGRMFDLSAHRQAMTSIDVVFEVPSLAGGTAQLDLYAR